MFTTRKLITGCLTFIVLLSAPVSAATPTESTPVGTVQVLPVISVSLAVGGTGHDTKRVVYAPPPGWHVRCHRVVVNNKYGAVTYTVSTLPARCQWNADEQTTSSSRSSAAGTVSAYKVSGGGQIAASGEATAADHTAVTSSHHMLVLDVSARGNGFLQSGSGVELTVFAEVVYLGR